eukprot:9661982-Karenia_brevis.AAC.1
MEDAYRSLANCDAHLPYCIVAVYDIKHDRPAFALFYALLFGQASAVPNFNRVPAFLSSLACGLHA